ncbi:MULTISPECIES: TIGR03668 family PPOX class F420-dependent oxidoreductase [unclassified Nonomuraea]|uniref:TIGR03668 family PPOX class F420-dependent oxidoreductase n=1 Tax=unclassified Nonomuraea TaxID=2593643 RepID=UPI0035C1991A
MGVDFHTGPARARFAAQRVARLARLAPDGTPRVVPITFALDGDTVVTAVDHKPKTTTDLSRLRDIRANPAVSVLADHYEDDWTRLWWVRADGRAFVLEDGRDAALDLLAAKYRQYRERRPEGPVIVVEVTRWSEWSATP